MLILTQGVVLEAGLLGQRSFSHTHLRTSALAPNLLVLRNRPISHHGLVALTGSVQSPSRSLELAALISNKPPALGLKGWCIWDFVLVLPSSHVLSWDTFWPGEIFLAHLPQKWRLCL